MKRMNRKELETYCEEYSIDLYDEMPVGWVFTIGTLTAPWGTEWINNKRAIWTGQRKTGLLITNKQTEETKNES